MTFRTKKIGAFLCAILAVMVLTVTLTACFNGDTVIKFNSNGGSPIEDLVITGEEESITLPIPTKEGYEFGGWYSDRSLNNRVDDVLTGEDIPTASDTFYAKWTEIKVTITFTVQGNIVGTKTVSYGSSIKIEDYPSLDNYPDYEWTTGAFTASYDRTVAATIKKEASNPKYSVTYYALNENKEYVEYLKFIDYPDVSIVLPTTPSAPEDGKDYYFAGWYFDTKGTNECKELPTKITEKDVVLYAIFTEVGNDSEFLYYEETANGIVITGLTAIGRYQASISIPSVIGGKNVVAVGFESETKTVSELSIMESDFVETVILPDTLQLVGDFAFLNCTALKRVVFSGNSLAYIGKGAFAGCSSLQEISIPDNVTAIGDFAFASITDNEEKAIEELKLEGAMTGSASNETWYEATSSLATIELGQNSKLSYVGDYAFFGCSFLKETTLSKAMRDFNHLAFNGSGIEKIDFYAGGNLIGFDGVVYTADGKTLCYYPAQGKAEYVVREGTLEIAPYAFNENKAIKSITLSEQLLKVGTAAFRKAENLESAIFAGDEVTDIGDYAFFECKKLLSAELPADLVNLGAYVYCGDEELNAVRFRGGLVKEIKEYAFNDCAKLVTIKIPNAVTKIGDYAFYACNDMGSLTFGAYDTLLTIGDYAFADCYTLGETTLPSSITGIGEYAFAGLTKRMNLEISDETDLGRTVKYYGDYAFSNTSIIKFTMSTAIENNASFGKYVFKDCIYLKRVSFSYTTTYDTVPEGLFYNCSAIEQVSFPNNIFNVSNDAFYGCTNLSEVTFNKVVSIGDNSFANCVKLVNRGDTKRIIPVGATHVGKRAFYNCDAITEITVPSTLTILNEEIFAECDNLANIYYDANTTVTTIGAGAFANCVAMVNAQLPYTLKIRDENDTTGLVKNPFMGCTQLKSFSFNAENENGLYVEDGVVYRTLYDGLGNELTERAIYAYPTAKSFVAVTIPAGVSAIDRYAFAGSTINKLNFARNATIEGTEAVTLIDIGDYAFFKSDLISASFTYRVKRIGKYAFYQSKLASFDTDDTYIFDGCVGYVINNELDDYDNNALNVDDYAFSETLVETIIVPTRTARVGKGAFMNNYQLYSFDILDGTITDLTIDDYAFYGNARLKTILIPARVTDIGEGAFAYDVNVADIVFSAREKALVLGKECFAHVHYLYEIYLPANLTVFGEGIFKGDTRLKNVYFGKTEDRTIGGGLEISASAFEGAYAIEEITIPSYVTMIGDYAFFKTELSSITFEGNASNEPLSIGKYAFSEAVNLESIALPDNLVLIDENAFSNSVLKNIEFSDSGLPLVIGDYALASTNVEGFSFGERILSIGKYSFSNTKNLANVEFLGNITVISEGAFMNTPKLTEVGINQEITEIGSKAFLESAINEIDVVSVSVIGESAFAKSGLTTVSISYDGDVNVGKEAFFTISGLTSLSVSASGSLTIGDYAFANNVKLSAFSLEGDVITLGNGFAYGLTSLASDFNFVENNQNPNYYFDSEERVLYSADRSQFVFYPAGKEGAIFTPESSITAISDYAFFGNTLLMGVVLTYDGIIPKGENTFGNVANLTYYVGKDYVDAYKNAWGTENVIERKVIGSGYVITLLNSDKYAISGYLGEEENLIIDGTIVIEDTVYEIIAILDGAFMNNTLLKSVNIVSGIKSIGKSAFRNCANLTSVIIGDSVNTIGSYAFYQCALLNNLTFAEEGSLTSIGNYAFSNATSLVDLVIPGSVENIGIFAFAFNSSLYNLTINNGVKNVGNNAFEGCTSLVKATLPESIESIGSYVFNKCDRLIYLVFDSENVPTINANTFDGVIDGIYFFVPSVSAKLYRMDSIWRNHITQIIAVDNICAVTNYEKYVIAQTNASKYELIAYLGTDLDKDVVIESNISEDIIVESIGEYAFGQFVEKITLSEGIKEIGARAFTYAVNLDTIILPKSMEIIGDNAFENLSKLSVVEIPEDGNLVSVGKYAFNNCHGVESILFPAGVKTIGTYAFGSTDNEDMNLSSVTFSHNNITAQDSVSVYIDSYAFTNNVNLRNIEFNCYVSGIGEGAFANCINLEGIYLNYVGPNANRVEIASITKVEEGIENVFENCNKLSIVVPSETFVALYKNNWDYVYDANRVVAKTYVVDDGVYGEFVYSIVSATNKTVTVINYLGDEKVIEFPKNVIINRQSYSVVRIGRENNSNPNVINGYVISDEVTEVTIPTSIKTIGADAFRNSKSLKKVNITDVAGTASTLEVIEEYAFSGCANLTDINIPKTVTRIASNAFSDCTSLNEGLVFSEFVNTPGIPTLAIQQNAFLGCTSLTSITFPNQLLSIGAHAFEGCNSLATVRFAEDAGIDTIGEYAFGNSAIKEITVPASVKAVNNYAFDHCVNLRAVYLMREITAEITTLTASYRNVFNGITSPHLKVYVPENAYGSYRGATGWSQKTVVVNSITEDKQFAYKINEGGNSVTLTAYLGESKELVIPRSIKIAGYDYTVTAIAEYFGNENITSVAFSEGCMVTSINDYAFSGCSSLGIIHIPNVVAEVGKYAFEDCVSLYDVVLSETLVELSEYTFFNCRSLEEIAIPVAITSIGNATFYNCVNLVRIVIFNPVVNPLGNMAFYNVANEQNKDFCIIVPNASKGTYAAQWIDVSDKIVSDTYLIGDFVVEDSGNGSWILTQYLGDEYELDLTTMTLLGKKITEIKQNAIHNDTTTFVVDENVKFGEELTDRVTIKEEVN